MYIKDLQSGEVRKYGLNHHDALRVSRDGTILSYENLQNGDGSRFGDYRFCDKDGLIPEEDEVLVKYGADAYFNIGGFVEVPERKKGEWIDDGFQEEWWGEQFTCSICVGTMIGISKYCPECGSEMREETK